MRMAGMIPFLASLKIVTFESDNSSPNCSAVNAPLEAATAAVIHEENLTPPDLLATQPDSHQPYYIQREHVMDRIYDQNVGYWEANLRGLAHPSRTDRAELPR